MSQKEHSYLIFSDKPRINSNTDAAALITNFFFHNKQSLTKWRKDKNSYTINWTDRNGTKQTSSNISYLIISNFIRENGYFDTQKFNLPNIECFWLDFSLDMKINWHTHDETAPNGLAIHDGVGQQQYGKDYPIVPKLHREGHSFTTMQPQILHRIVTLRKKLVENSNLALEDDWFFDLRSMINETVSIVEITLNQIYNKAQFDPLSSWKFDKADLGEKHGRRFEDKLKWIFKISGKHIGAESYMSAVNNLRELRNHMMHFDPPSLIITIEEASIWLNQVIDVGYLLIRIRQAIGVEVSLQLINFILQKEVIFNPETHFSNRLPLGNPEFDYASSNWKK